MPRQIIIDHFKKVKALEEELDKETEKYISGIDVEALLEAPEAELSIVVQGLIDHIKADVLEKATELGIDFGKQLKKMADANKTIEVKDGTDKQKEQLFDGVPPPDKK